MLARCRDSMVDMESTADIQARRDREMQITNAQIDAAIAIRRDPENWALVPIEGTKLMVYRRKRVPPVRCRFV
jgi:hypothetical protein